VHPEPQQLTDKQRMRVFAFAVRQRVRELFYKYPIEEIEAYVWNMSRERRLQERRIETQSYRQSLYTEQVPSHLLYNNVDRNDRSRSEDLSDAESNADKESESDFKEDEKGKKPEDQIIKGKKKCKNNKKPIKNNPDVKK